MKGFVVKAAAQAIDKVARAIGSKEHAPQHILTGLAGEDMAYFHLRELGYIIIARNWRTANCKGELDLVGWDGDVLCFVEVKTRTTRAVKPAEAAVDEHKRRELALVARRFLWRLKREKSPPYRFDIISIYVEKDCPPAITLFKNAFPVP